MSVTAMKSKDGTAEDEASEEKKGGKKKLILIAVVLLLVGGAAYWFVLKPKGGDAAPVAGEILPLDSTQINLAGGHYLKIGIALQLTKGATEVDGSKAMDATIELFSGRPIAEMSNVKTRKHLKEELSKELDETYEGQVMDVYFTEFVTQ
ncbi:flagellar basal body-associated FliL family protein [Nocardioides sp. CN2-186]|uniref:flagellar basal body-associated FliL family protein n=1 Tax=Nocardioides tweenelious TaxID=3156607 RepID=UPI0032B4AF57